MDSANVEIVRQSLDAYARRDVEALRALNDPDVQLDWSASRGWLAGVYRGIDAALRFYAGYFEAFDEIVIEPDRFIDVGDSVIVPNVAHQRGRDGIEVSARSTLVFTLRNRKLTRICLYQETQQALEAVGLRRVTVDSANLDLVRSIYAGWERGDFSTAEWAHPAIEFVIIGGPDPGSWRGVDGMAEGWYRFLGAWDDFHVTADEQRELDDERVLALIRRSGRGRASRMEVAEMHSKAADLFYVCDGMVMRLVHYWQRGRALADLGLAPEGG